MPFIRKFNSVKKVERVIDNLTGVYISCNHMCYTYCYGFSVNKEDRWLFSADCSISNEDDFQRVNINCCQIEDIDIEKLFKILKKKDNKGKTLLEFVSSYKSPKRPKFIMVCDETTYGYGFSYIDCTNDSIKECPDKEIEKFFYKLAEKYAKYSKEE